VRDRTAWLPWTRAGLDAASIIGAVLLAYWYRYHLDRIPVPGTEPPAFSRYLIAIPVVAAIFLLTFAVNGAYAPRRPRGYIDDVFAMTGSAFVATLFVLAAMSLYRGFSYSRLVLAYSVFLALVLIALNRALLRSLLIRWLRGGRAGDRVLIVGGGSGSELLIQRMSMFPQYGYRVCGVVADGSPVEARIAGAPVLGPIEQLPVLVRQYQIDQVFLALPGATHEQLLHLVKTCDDLAVDFKMVPDVFDIITTRVSADVVDGIPLVGVRRSALEGGGLLLKRAFDLVVASVLLVLLSPFLLAITLIIRLATPGAALYRQQRVGREGKVFTLLKFRSMVPDAEAETGPVFASQDDTRRTPVGRWMRRFSLDELPQLINVLLGDMSLVGPRPERPFFVDQFGAEIPRYLERHQVQPGITGWAQVNDLRGHTSVANRTVYDIYYTENWSLAFDLKILLLTVWRLFFHHHAY
jgi:exopolysaccharide biosynthesis polyprenyl glycosylphosphotransferase